MSDKVKQLYDTLTKDGYELGDYDSYVNRLKDENDRKVLYDTITADNYDVGEDFDKFSSNIGYSKPAPTSRFAKDGKIFDVPFAEYKAMTSQQQSAAYDAAIEADRQEALNNTGKFVKDAQGRVDEGLKSAYERYHAEEQRKTQENPFLTAFADSRHARIGLGLPPTARMVDQEIKDLHAASENLQEAEHITEEAKKKGNTNFAGGFVRGFGQKAFNPNTWDSGFSEMSKNTAVAMAAQKKAEGKPLTQSEELVLEGAAINQAVGENFSDDLGRGYKAGTTTGESLPFMADILIHPASRAGRAVAGEALQGLVKKYGYDASKRMLIKAGTGAARVVGDVAGASAMSVTTGAVKVLADAQERNTGHVDYDIDDSGYIWFKGASGGEDYGTSLAKAFGAHTIENYSEMLGESFGVVGDFMGRLAGKGARKIGLGQVVDALDNVRASDWAKSVGDFQQATQWNGTIGEFMEEQAGTALNALLVGDQKLSDLTDVDQQIDTFLGVGVMGGFFSAIKTAGYRNSRGKIQKELESADAAGQEAFGTEWKNVRDEVDLYDMEKRHAILYDALNSDMNQDKKQALMEYAMRRLQYNGANIASQKRLQEGDVHPLLVQLEDAYESGEQIMEPAERFAARKDMESAMGMLGLSEEGMSELETLSPATAISKAVEVRATDEVVGNMLSYYNAKAKYDGMIEGIQSDISSKIKRSGKAIDQRTHPDGNVYDYTLKVDDNAHVNVIQGNIIVGEDGIIDANSSDEKVIVRTDEGKLEMRPTSDLFKVFSTVNAELLKQDTEKTIIDQEGRKASDEIEGIRDFQPNEVVMIQTPEGAREVIVNGQTPDGQYEVYSVDGKPISGKEVATLFDRRTLSLMEQEAQKVMGAAETPAVEGASTDVNSTVPTGVANVMPTEGMIAEGVPGEIAPDVMPGAEAIQDASSVVGELPVGEAAQQLPGEEVAPVEESTPRIPVDAKGNALYHRAPVEDTLADLLDGTLEDLEVDEFIAANKKESAKVLDKVKANPPKIGTNKVKYLQDKQEWAAKVADVQSQADYWVGVESKLKEMREQPGDSTAEEINAMGEPMNGAEFAAMMLGKGKLPLLVEDYKNETGFGTGESKRMLGVFAKEENGGMSIGRAAESLMDYATDMGYRFPDMKDSMEARDLIIDVLSQSNTRGDLGNYIKNRREELAERERRAELEAYENLVSRMAEANHMTSEEFVSYEEVANNLIGETLQRISDEEFKTIFVEQNIQDYDGIRESDEMGTGVPEGEERAGGNEGGGSILGANGILDETASGRSIDEGQERDDESREPGGSLLPEAVAAPRGEQAARSAESTGEEQSVQSAGEEQSRERRPRKRRTQGLKRKEGESLFDFAERVVQNDAVAIEEEKVDTNPTDGQKEAGNYRKGHIKLGKYDVTIENPAGSERSGTDASGKSWSVTMNNTYGYFRGTEGKDGDHIDLFLGDNLNQDHVYVVDQVNPDGSFDEHKVMWGFSSVLLAKQAYLKNYSPGWQGLGKITKVSRDVFDEWMSTGTKKQKPFAEYKAVKESIGQESGQETAQEVGKEQGQENIQEPNESSSYGSGNRIVSMERYDELRGRLREKLNRMNVGFDPELFAIGSEMAAFHIEAGAHKFGDFAQRMIADVGNNIRPYLKSFYEAARNFPGMQEIAKNMTPYREVAKFDVDKFDADSSQSKEENATFVETDKNKDYESTPNTTGNHRSDQQSRVLPGLFDGDVSEQSASTEEGSGRAGEQRTVVEESGDQPGTGRRSGERTDVDASGTVLHSGERAGDLDIGRTDRGNSRKTGEPLTPRNNKQELDTPSNFQNNRRELDAPLNSHNNRQERGLSVVPKGDAGKIRANMAAIKLAKKLRESGKKATPEQMDVLRQYSGWGGLSSVFKPADKNYQALKDLLSEDEYEAARASTTTAFYTPQEITSSVWDMVEKLGFKGGSILEPSAGIGNFFALMPETISNHSRLRGIELDTLSGSILGLLYPDAKINVSGYEEQRIANNSVDLVVSNVPFGNFKVHDSNEKDLSSKFDIHDYFIAKSVRKLKPGGIGVFITTSSSLDKSKALREWLISETGGNADFVDAVRLNTETFKNEAGTEATSDIIILRKRDEKGRASYAKDMLDVVVSREALYTVEEKGKYYWETKEVEKTARMTYNQYFSDNPGRMAGEMKFGFEGGNAIRPTEQRLAAVGGIEQSDVIRQMIKELPADIYNDAKMEQSDSVEAPENDGTKEGGITLIDGKPYIVQFGEVVPVEWNDSKVKGKAKTEVLADYISLKKAIAGLLDVENTADSTDEEVEKKRSALNQVYDGFVKKYGALSENRALTFLQDDVDFVTIAAVENVDEEKESGKKAVSKSDIFQKRVINPQRAPMANTIKDAVQVSMNQHGRLDARYISELLDTDIEGVKAELLEKNLGMVDPASGLIVEKGQYLSGNVREKLRIAQQANHTGEYNANIEELSKVIPADVPMNLISVSLGSTWVPTKIYDAFFQEAFGVEAKFSKTMTDKYVSPMANQHNSKDMQMGMVGASGSTMALNAMNNTKTNIYTYEWKDGRRVSVIDPIATAQAATKQAEINSNFEEWLKKKTEYAPELEEQYNDIFNAVVKRKIDVESFDRFPGAGGKVVILPKIKEGDKEIKRFRLAKENSDADNAGIVELARKLGLYYDSKAKEFSTESGAISAQFMEEANGTSKILREHQKVGVNRSLESATLLAHEVGTGKTLTLITASMEMRRLGLAKKPVIVVQRSTYKQFVKEIKNQYPKAKVLAPSAKELTAKERQQLFAKVAYNDWDIVVLYHSFLDSIPDDPQRVAKYIDERIQEKMSMLGELEISKTEGGANAGRMIGALKKEIERLELERTSLLSDGEVETSSSNKRGRSVKDVEKARSNATAKAKQAVDRRTDKTLNFEQLGVDALLIDEAHAYKKLGFSTSLQGVKGIDTALSKRAQSTRLKTSYILETQNGKNVVFATGTPISNTMAEMWTFMRYLLPKSELERLLMNNFDAFVNNFGTIEESAEFSTSGKFRVTNRFSSYSNVPELISAWLQVAHTVLTEEISTLKEGEGTPRVEGGMPSDVMLEQTPTLKAVMKGIKEKLEWFDSLSGAEKKSNSHIPLVMFGLAKRAAIDARLVDPNLPDEAGSKTNKAVSVIMDDLRITDEYHGTIALFCDSFQSSDGRFNVFEDIKQKLIDKGVPAEQIAIINDYKSDDAKEKLFKKVNSGEVRVVMGTTEKLGVGVNIQERLHTAIHTDAPLRPSDYQQRNGRIMRQGNKHLDMDKTIRIVRLGVQKTLDVTGYQRLEIKKKFIDQIMKGDTSSRTLEESDEENSDSNNFNQMMANLSGSQAALALSIEQNKLKKLYNSKQYHEDNQVYMASEIKRAENVLSTTERSIQRLEEHQSEVLASIPGGAVTEVSIGKVKAETPEGIEALLHTHIGKKVDAAADELRNNFMKENTLIKASMQANGVKVDLEIEVKRNYDMDTKKTRVTRSISYVTPDNQVVSAYRDEMIPLFAGNAGANLLNVISDINEMLVGRKVAKEIMDRKVGMERAQRTIEAFRPQMGQSFPKQKDLEKAELKVEELEERMKEELAAIEAEEAADKTEVISIDELTESEGEGVRFREIEDVNEQFNEELQQQIDGMLPEDHVFQLGMPSDALQASGVPNLQIELSAERLEKKSNQENHPFDIASVFDLPNAIQKPIAIFDSTKKDGSKIVLTELQFDEHNFVTILRVQRKGSGRGKIQINDIRSIYPKDNASGIVDWINSSDKLLKWVDKEKALNFISVQSTNLIGNGNKNQGLDSVAIAQQQYNSAEVAISNDNPDSNSLDQQHMNRSGNIPADVVSGLADKSVTQENLEAATNIINDFENPTLLQGNIVAEVDRLSDELHASVHIIRDVNEIPPKDSRKRKSKGWYDPPTNQVYFVLPNATSVEDAIRTVLHETVAHKGLRKLFGKEFDSFLDRVYKNASEDVCKKIVELARRKYDWDFRIATEEYMARLAEDGFDKEPALWQQVKYFFADLLEKVGVHVELNDNDLRYILWKSYKNLQKGHPVFDAAEDVLMREKLFSEKKEKPFFRDDIGGEEESSVARDEYEHATRTKLYKFQEAYQDSMLGLKKLQEAISKETGRVIKDHENAYMAENQLSSKNSYESEFYRRNFFDAMMKSVNALIKAGKSYQEVVDYMVAKHGLERNEVMARRDAKAAVEKEKGKLDEALREGKMDDTTYSNKLQSIEEVAYQEFRNRDYAGLTALTGEEDVATSEMMAQEMVDSFEADFEEEAKELWKRVNAATKETLRKNYESGMMSKANYEKIQTMYVHYIPLRGWTEDIASDVYEYLSTERSSLNPAVKTAKGRTSLADDPLATIGNMAESTILQGNRNLMKQKFLNMVQNHHTSLVTTREMWYENMGTDEHPKWERSFPDLREDYTEAELMQALSEHEERMKLLESEGRATKALSGLQLNYRANQWEKKEHLVVVKRGGKEHLVFVNGNPRATQAINGLTNPDASQNAIMKGIRKINRQMAANFTTRNPAFVISNLSRDLIFSASAVAVKEDGKYTKRFTKNVAKNVSAMVKLMWRYQHGKLDVNNARDRYFKEFLENGGETGYTALHGVDEYKKLIDRQVMEAQGKVDLGRIFGLPAGKVTATTTLGVVPAFRALAKWTEFGNRCAEDVSRFTTYQTSREMGRSVARSVSDAKEITVNFNKKGSGGKGQGWLIEIGATTAKSLFLFFNAAVQSLNNFYRLGKKNPFKLGAVVGGFMAAGMLVPMMNELLIGMFGDDDDKDAYRNLPEWIRKNNLCIWTGGDSFITIPLPIELRAFYGMGGLFNDWASGELKHKNVGLEMAKQLTDLLPLDPLGGNSSFVPDAAKPFYQIATNKDFFGKPIYKDNDFNQLMPEYTKAYKGTSKLLIASSELLNEISGGDKYKKGSMDEISVMGFTPNNPAQVEHLFESYFGGMGKTVNQVGKTISMIWDEDQRAMRNVPVANRFINIADERTKFSRVNEHYFYYKKEFDQVGQQVRGYEKEADLGIFEYAEKVDFLNNSKEYQRYELFKEYQPELKGFIDDIKEADGEERKHLELMLNLLKSELVEQLDGIK